MKSQLPAKTPVADIQRRPLVLVRNLKVFVPSQERAIVCGFSCDILPGETVALFGPSGQGKTSVALALAGLLSSGLRAEWERFELDGTLIVSAKDEDLQPFRGASVGFVFQDPLAALNPVLPCGSQIEEPLRFHRLADAKERRARALALLRELGLRDPERIYLSLPVRLSGGQLQRVVLARALISNPAFLIADEPTTALDPQTRRDVVDLLSQIRRRHDMAILLITHDRGVVRSLADRTIDIDGSLISFATEGDELMRSDDLSTVQRKATEQPLALSRSPPLLSIRGLSKAYAARGPLLGFARNSQAVFRDIDLDVHAGEMVGLIGVSGVGKTTLLRCIAGLTAADAGTVLVNGIQRRADRHGRRNGEVQMIFQNPYLSLPPHLTVWQTLCDGLRAGGTSEKLLRPEAERLLADVRLEVAVLERYPRELSGGQCQRVAIARCLARQPKMLLADEPTAALDERNKGAIVALLRRAARDKQIGIIVVTHDHNTLANLADSILRFENGKILPFENVTTSS